MIKQMFISQQYAIAIIFFVLLTVIAFGIMNAVVRMSFDEPKDKEKQRFSINKVLPQLIILSVVMLLSFCMTNSLYETINEAIKWIY